MTLRLDQWIEKAYQNAIDYGNFESEDDEDFEVSVSRAMAAGLGNGEIPRPDWMIIKEQKDGCFVSDEEMPNYELWLGK